MAIKQAALGVPVLPAWPSVTHAIHAHLLFCRLRLLETAVVLLGADTLCHSSVSICASLPVQ